VTEGRPDGDESAAEGAVAAGGGSGVLNFVAAVEPLPEASAPVEATMPKVVATAKVAVPSDGGTDTSPLSPSGTVVGRATVGAPVPESDLGPAKSKDPPEPAHAWGKQVLVGVLAVALAAIITLVLVASRPSGPLSLPLPPGMSAPMDGGAIPTPAGTDATGTAPGATAGPAGSGGAGSGSGTAGGAGPSGGSAGGAVPGGAVPGGAGPVSAGPVSPAPATQVGAAPPPAPEPLHAAYATVGQSGLLGLTGYDGQVTISNPGSVTVNGWTVTISLPSGEQVSQASGAGYTQSGTTVTFRPASGTASVSGHGSVRFTFGVTGLLAGPPTGCAIDGRPCG
jgi:hypothetical protein